MPFLMGHPDHWISPAPGVDDASSVIEEEVALEEKNTDLTQRKIVRVSAVVCLSGMAVVQIPPPGVTTDTRSRVTALGKGCQPCYA